MTEEQAHELQKREYPGWPDSLDEAKAHPVFGRLLRARAAVANALPRKSFPKRRATDFDYKKAQSGDKD